MARVTIGIQIGLMNGMTEYTPSVTLYPKRLSAAGHLLTCGVFVVIGIWWGITKSWVGFLCAGFFALGGLVALVQLVPGSTYLQVHQQGFTLCTLFRKSTVPWSAVDEFFVVTMRQSGVKVHEMVGFNFVPTYDQAQLGRRIAKVIGKCEGALPDTYGKKAEELAEFMNSCLAKVKSEGGEQSHADNTLKAVPEE